MHKHNCIKCGQVYEDGDVDAYYCDSCNEQRLLIAKQIDSKVGSTVGQQPKGELKLFDDIAHAKGGAKNNFVNIKDLGITL